METTPETDATITGVPYNERETTINGTDADETIHIWSCRRRHITAMRKHPAFTETETGDIALVDQIQAELRDLGVEIRDERTTP